MKKAQRFRYLWLVLPLLTGLWVAWPDASKPGAGTATRQAAPSAGPGGTDITLTPESDAVGRPRATRVRERPVTPETRVRIDRVLANDAISSTEAAVIFHDLVVDPSLPVEDRLEALEHGLNLDSAPFARLAETPDLPPELAAKFLNAVINQNDTPELQIQSYLALLNHPDPEISKTAADMLAFLVEDDQRQADPAALVKLAQKKLAEIRQTPPAPR